MLITMRSVPLAQDSRIVIACIRACIWASIEDRPFCVLPNGMSYSTHGRPDEGQGQGLVVSHFWINEAGPISAMSSSAPH
jgi:hypothetical protein